MAVQRKSILDKIIQNGVIAILVFVVAFVQLLFISPLYGGTISNTNEYSAFVNNVTGYDGTDKSWDKNDETHSLFAFGLIRGHVTNSEGEPLVGVSVSVKGGKSGTSTDQQGNYSLDVPEDGIIIFSFVGFETKEVPVRGREIIDLVLDQTASELQQVVVVGYGTQKKSDVTGAISAIEGGDLKQSPAANISNSIAGRIPGVILNNRSGEPGLDASEFLIRGKGTLNDNSPLIVIDGVANRGDFDRLNPDDIESLSVLKDASAAIYGAQAANGVILITTKRGKTGAPVISYNGSYGLTQPTRLPKLINAYQFTVYKNELDDRIGIPHEFTDEQVQGYKNGNDPLNFPNTDWTHATVKNLSPQTQHSVSVSGGTEKIDYFLSGQYLYQDGIFRNSATDYKQYNIRSNIDAKISKNFKISLDLSGRIEDRNYSNFNSGSIFRRVLITFPTLPAYYPNGLPGAGVEGGLNPVLMANGKTGYNKLKDSYLQSNFSFELKLPWITNGLFISGLAAYDFHFNNDKTFNNNWDAFNYDKNLDQYTNLRTQEGPINLSESFRNYRMQTYNIRIGYDKQINDNNINAFIAYEQSENFDEGIEGFRTDYITDLIDQISAGGSTGQNAEGTAFNSARQNVFGRIMYSFQDKYLAEFILRHDGSINFPQNKRWGTFPGISVGWRISKEAFFAENVSFVNDLKLKASWGKMGNDKINPYQYLLQYHPDAGYYFGPGSNRVLGLSMGTIPNPNVTWEVADTKNIGFESSILNRSIRMEADYFYSKRSNILLPRNASIPSSTGLNDGNLPAENIGKVNNRGYELSISHYRNIRNFTFNVGFNFTHAKNDVVFMDEASGIPDWQRIQGHPMDSWLIYRSDGIYKTEAEVDRSPHLPGAMPGDIKYIDIDGDGEITSLDMVRVYESPTPLNNYGVTLGIKYKGFGLDLLLQGQGSAMQVILPQQIDDNTTIPEWMFKDRWTADNPDGRMPASFDRTDSRNNLLSDFWIRNAGFIRLKSAELSYSFTQNILDRLSLKDLGVFVNGFNLLTMSKIKNYDPELNAVSGSYYPQIRIFNAGVRISF